MKHFLNGLFRFGTLYCNFKSIIESLWRINLSVISDDDEWLFRLQPPRVTKGFGACNYMRLLPLITILKRTFAYKQVKKYKKSFTEKGFLSETFQRFNYIAFKIDIFWKINLWAINGFYHLVVTSKKWRSLESD